MMNPQVTINQLPDGNLHIHVPMILKKIAGRKLVIAPNVLDGENINAEKLTQEPLIMAIANALNWSSMIETGQVKSVTELSRNLNLDGSFLSRMLRLSTLAPEIITSIALGREPDGISLNKLLVPFPSCWDEQRKIFGFEIG